VMPPTLTRMAKAGEKVAARHDPACYDTWPEVGVPQIRHVLFSRQGSSGMTARTHRTLSDAKVSRGNV
jgi:hypothetical protein